MTAEFLVSCEQAGRIRIGVGEGSVPQRADLAASAVPRHRKEVERGSL